MPRPFRIDFPGALAHIHNRGVEKRDIFLDDHDRRYFIKLLGEVAERYRWRVHAFTQMTTHYHLLVEALEATLSLGMQKLNGDYASYFNKRHGRVGHLFQARFSSHLVDSEEYLLTVARYILLNPVRARMVTTVSDWPWSSYRATAGIEHAPSWLDTRLILDRFDERDRQAAQRLFRHFVDEASRTTDSPWDKLVAGAYLGGPTFIARIEEMTALREQRAHDSQRQARVRARSIEEANDAVEAITEVALTPKRWSNELARLAFAYVARAVTTAPFTTIARHLSVSPSGARALHRRAVRLVQSDRRFSSLVEKVRLTLASEEERRTNCK